LKKSGDWLSYIEPIENGRFALKNLTMWMAKFGLFRSFRVELLVHRVSFALISERWTREIQKFKTGMDRISDV
jgi:hypothetical protein